MKKEEVLNKLNEGLSAKDISSRDEKGRTLRYVEGHFVIDQLNQIFGNTNWEYNIKELKQVSQKLGQTKTGKEAFFIGYIAQVNLIVPNVIEGGKITINDIGYGSGIDADEGKAHESATKEAITDSLKRCAKSLGNKLGLCLYDKNYQPAKTVGGYKTDENGKAIIIEKPKTTAKFEGAKNTVAEVAKELNVEMATDKQVYILEKKYNHKDTKNLTKKQASELIKSYIDKQNEAVMASLDNE